jgi:uncharacterized membrane protein
MASAIADQFAKTLLREDYVRLDPQAKQVIDRIVELAPQPAPELGEPSWLDLMADRVAKAFRSWWFVAGIVVLMAGWFLLNGPWMSRIGWAADPYPFTFLRLMLSVLAVVQGPIILISQHHSDTSKRVFKSYDSANALQARVEILRLHERFDGFEAALAERRMAPDDRAGDHAQIGPHGTLRPRAANSDFDPASHDTRRLAAHRRGVGRFVGARPASLISPQPDLH